MFVGLGLGLALGLALVLVLGLALGLRLDVWLQLGLGIQGQGLARFDTKALGAPQGLVDILDLASVISFIFCHLN